MVKIRRIYDSPAPAPGDGKRFLVDRLWPRGLKKEEVVVDEWIKDVAPSNDLRKWFGHDPSKWQEFKKRYTQELEGKRELLAKLKREARAGTITILYAARDEEHNNAVVLKSLIG